MKNIYKKFIKVMEKSNVVMLERSGNNYFISNITSNKEKRKS